MLNTDWDLSPIYESFSDKAYTEDYAWVQEECDSLKEFINSGDKSKEWLKEVLRRINTLYSVFSRLASFSHLTLAVDATNEFALAEYSKISVQNIELEKITNAVSRIIITIPELNSIVESDDYLSQFSFVISELCDEAKHMLPEAIEASVLSMQLTGGIAWQNLRDILDGTATVNYRGEILPLPNVRNLAYDMDPAVRKDAYEAELKAYPSYEIPMAASLNGIKGEAILLAKLKGYDSVLDNVLHISRMDQQTLDVMIGSMERYLPKFREYLKAKAKYLGHENGMPFYDMFAPMGEGSLRFTYEEAHTYLVEVLGKFSGEMAQFVDYAFRNRWIDALPKKGKGGGAFCASIHAIQESRVLSNFIGSFSDVSTLAHELGHAFHGYCLKGEDIINCNYPMPLAETASIFNELLVADAALEGADEKTTIAILESELMEATQVIVDIYSRYLFESELFSSRAKSTISVDELKAMMITAQKKAYGDGLDHNVLHPYMWQNKTHYYFTDLHFYNFPYAFGLLFGHGVFAQYKNEGPAFSEKYKMLLRSTGKNSVADTAMKIGIDIHSSDFWISSLEDISKTIDRFIAAIS